MPAGAVTLPTTPTHDARPGWRGVAGDGTVVAGLVTAGALVAAAAGWSSAWGLLTVVGVACWLAPGWRGALTALPAAALSVMGVGIVALLVTWVAGQRVLLSSTGARAVLAVVTVGAVASAVALRRDRPLGPPRAAATLALAASPAALMAVLLAVIRWSGESRLAWFLSADHLRHLGLTTRTVDAGTLDYAAQPFPRGWHALMATLWSATGSERDGDGLARLVGVQSAATWALLVLVPLVLALLGVAVAEALGLGRTASGLAGLVSGSLVLGPWFFGDYVPRGFDTTILVVLVLATAVQVALADRRSRAALAAACAACLLIAHTWQVLLVPAGALAVAVLLWRRPWTLPPRARVVDALVVVGLAAASLPGVSGVLRGIGLEQAALAGDVPPPVLWWFALVLLSCAGVVAVARGAGLPLVVPTVATAATAWALAAATGVAISSYYPSKTLWVATALGLPALGGAVVLLLARVDGAAPARRVLVVLGGAVVALMVLVSVASPVFGVLRSSWGAADSAAVMRVATSDAARSATVVWRVGTPVDDATTQLLIDFYSADADTPRLGLAATRVAEQCALLVEAPRPVVLTTAPAADVTARFACRPDASVVPPPSPATTGGAGS